MYINGCTCSYSAFALMHSLVIVDLLTLSLNFAENFPPSMEGESVFRVTVGQPATYSFTVKDEGDEFTVLVEEGLPPEATLSDNTAGDYSLHWTPASPTEQPLTFVAMDVAGATAKLKPQVQVCGCVNGGECTLDGIFDLELLSSVVMNCNCPEGGFHRACKLLMACVIYLLIVAFACVQPTVVGFVKKTPTAVPILSALRV